MYPKRIRMGPSHALSHTLRGTLSRSRDSYQSRLCWSRVVLSGVWNQAAEQSITRQQHGVSLFAPQRGCAQTLRFCKSRGGRPVDLRCDPWRIVTCESKRCTQRHNCLKSSSHSARIREFSPWHALGTLRTCLHKLGNRLTMIGLRKHVNANY